MKPHKFDDEKSQKAKSNQSEKELAKKLGGKRQPASGAITGHKGDVKTSELLIDLKETDSKSIIVKLGDLHKIMNEANGEGKDPALVLRFNKAKVIDKEWIVLPLEVYEEMKK